MKPPASAKIHRKFRCAVYTRKSSEEGLEMEFNSLDAQREAGLAYIQSQKHEGWLLVGDRYDDGGFSGGTLEHLYEHSPANPTGCQMLVYAAIGCFLHGSAIA